MVTIEHSKMLTFIPQDKAMANLRIEEEKQKQEEESKTFNNAHNGYEFRLVIEYLPSICLDLC